MDIPGRDEVARDMFVTCLLCQRPDQAIVHLSTCSSLCVLGASAALGRLHLE